MNEQKKEPVTCSLPVSRRAAYALSGVALIEVLVSIVLIGIVAIAILYSVSTAMTVAKLTEVHYAASSIASSRIEELSAVNLADLDSSYNESDTDVVWPGLDIVFRRNVQVTVNGDNSRTINVRVASAHASLPANVRFVTHFAPWQ